MNSFDLDSENPESSFGSDLDRESLDSFASIGETGFSSPDHHGEASSLPNLGKTMAIGFSLGSLTQDSQEGEKAGTTWDPSLGMDRDSFYKKQKRKVTFSQETLEAYKAKCQNDRQQNSQLRQLEHNNKNCSNNNQQAWQNRPSMMQQQPARALAKELEHKRCIDNSLDSEEANLEEEDRALGSFEAQPQATTTSFTAFRSPKQQQQQHLRTGS